MMDMKSVVRLRSMACALLAAAALSTGCSPHHGQRSYTQVPGAQQGLRVVGYGEVEVPPDVARVRFGVMERGATAIEASNAVQKKMQAVMAALNGAGVPSAQIQTDRLMLRENREYRYRRMRAIEEGIKPTKDEKPAPDRYVANHSVELELTDLTRVGAVLAAVQNAGVNEINDVSFQLKDSEPALAKAREKAIHNAQAQAKEIATQAGVGLGRLISISSTDDGDRYGEGMRGGVVAGMAMKESSGAIEAPIAPGTLKFSEQIYMRYELGKPLPPARPAAAAAASAPTK